MKHAPKNIIATFSIVGYDPEAQEWGIAVQSKFLGVGALVPYARAGAGAVATQSLANTSYGPRGLELMESGLSAEEALEQLIKGDADREQRQVGLVDKQGRSASFTGKDCYEWAGGVTGPNYAAQGNILVGRETVETMGSVFEKSEGSLAERLLKALDAGQQAGGDRRGRQSAALLVVRDKGGYGGYNDRAIDLRVDDHPSPIKELIRIYGLQQLYFSPSKPEDVVTIDNLLKGQLTSFMKKLGYINSEADQEGARLSDEAFYKALTTFLHTENFEEREQELGKIDLAVVRFMKEKAEQVR
ncbi:DUF1028 domain-containing protein [Sporolactobacillus sp. THM7-4]|nr:DUF1028 domain-containing protein [Sporolactobacillus sp. THM7-4]